MLAEYEHERFGRVRSVAPPVVFSGYQPEHRPGPRLGADGPAILAELGYPEDEQGRLRELGAFGAVGPSSDRSEPPAEERRGTP